MKSAKDNIDREPNKVISLASKRAEKLANNPDNKEGIRVSLAGMLEKYAHQVHVDPFEYESLLCHAFEKGKLFAEEKFYFLAIGLTENILSFSHLSAFIKGHLSTAPWLEFFRSVRKKDLPTLRDEIFEGNAPGQKAKDYFWKTLLRDSRVEKRARKSFQQPHKIDVDDIPYTLPPAATHDDGVVFLFADKEKMNKDDRASSFSAASMLNSLPGFSQYLKTNAEVGDWKRTLQGIRSFVRLEAILDSRYGLGKKYHRFDEALLFELSQRERGGRADGECQERERRSHRCTV